ncbi:MAG: tRNA (N6-isopentenyl adenosine(37)-C2)-methylthiotransferase MiaB [Candidatus Cloacimonadota bacterium]|nr:MAG: tRNA (N6-isopentenyl adenosine(37)-C2)-methylthiotransferase MiaB [Candidatus Cloacimonadota bacterium]
MKFIIETYGCQMNVADSELVSAILVDAGFEKTEYINNADIIIFNTCTVRQHAEDRVIGRITQEARRKKEKTDLLIGIIGCVSQRIGNRLVHQISALDFAVGTDQYLQLPDIIHKCYEQKVSISQLTVNHRENYENIYPLRKKGISAFISIMRGCNNFCSYCIVPYTRGRERSRRPKEIIKEIMRAGKDGYKDITLLGQNVNSYFADGVDFPELLYLVNNISEVSRIRFVTSHPKDLSDRLIEAMASLDKVCEHIHLPMQSGSNKILKLMNRGYTIEHYLGLIKNLRKAIPKVAITTDIMCGFPGETELNFYETYQAMQEIEFDYAFTFKYSPRQWTKAAEMNNQIPEQKRLERLQKLIKLQEQITLKKYQHYIGKRVEVLVEQISKRSDKQVSGRARDNKIVVITGDKNLIGKFIQAKITDATKWTLKGEALPYQ